MNVGSGVRAQLDRNDFEQLSAYRYRVFVETLGWQLDTPPGLELDQFDGPDTAYIYVRNEHNHVCGCARLLPTTAPYLLSEVFPQLLNGQPIPSSPELWELSRFACMDFDTPHAQVGGQFSSDIGIELLQQTLNYARAQGARQLITVSPVGIERLLRKAGFRHHRIGAPTVINGYSLVALLIQTCADESATSFIARANRNISH